MSRETITLTAPNGAKVRTALGKRYYTVAFWQHEGKLIAEVVKRTDDIVVADREFRRRYATRVVFELVNGKPVAVRGQAHFAQNGR